MLFYACEALYHAAVVFPLRSHKRIKRAQMPLKAEFCKRHQVPSCELIDCIESEQEHNDGRCRARSIACNALGRHRLLFLPLHFHLRRLSRSGLLESLAAAGCAFI